MMRFIKNKKKNLLTNINDFRSLIQIDNETIDKLIKVSKLMDKIKKIKKNYNSRKRC